MHNYLAFLPSATVVAKRLCFHRCLSVRGGVDPALAWQTPTPGETPSGQTPSWADNPHKSSCGNVMFSQVSVCPQGGGVHPPGRHPSLPSRHPLAWQTPWTPRSRPLQRTVRNGMHSCFTMIPLYSSATSLQTDIRCSMGTKQENRLFCVSR